SGRETVAVEPVAGERAAEIGGARPAPPRLQRGRVSDVDFLEMLVVFACRDVEAATRDDMPFVEGVFIRMPERDQLVVTAAIRKIEAGDPADRLGGDVPRPFQR